MTSRLKKCSFCDEMLRRRFTKTHQGLFGHPHSQFGTATRTAAYVFCLRVSQLSVEFSHRRAEGLSDEPLQALAQASLRTTV